MKEIKTIVGKETDYPLKAKVVLPDNTGRKVPGVVLVHGSGPSNMDEQIFKLTPFKDIAEGLADKGIASIRYDKRTFAYGRKMKKQSLTVKEETIEDAIRAAKLLRTHPAIDPDRIYIIGHSMGAMLAPRIDAECNLFCGLILMAGTPFRLEDIMVRQLRQASASKGKVIKWIVALEDKIFTKKLTGLYEMSDEDAKRKVFAGSLKLWYFKEMGQKTAADYLLETDKPVMIMQGGMDFQVLADKDFEGFKNILKDKDNIEYRYYDKLNHIFVNGIYNDILKASKEYKVEQHIGPQVLDDISAFCNRRA